MNWKRRMSRPLFFAPLGGVAATLSIVDSYTPKLFTALPSKALGPAIELDHPLDPIYHARSHRYLEELCCERRPLCVLDFCRIDKN
jgi:hypothetical protein